MIVSFGDKKTENFFHGLAFSDFPSDIKERAFRKLDLLNAASSLEDLKIPPGNKLEKLTGRLKGFYSIRINEKYRVVFVWGNGNSHKVSIIDYH